MHRKVFDHELFRGEEFSRRDAWLYLIGLSEFEGSAAGCFTASIRELASKWLWSKSRVHRFLKCLELQEMIKKVSGTVSATSAGQERDTYRITNYLSFQTVNSSGGTGGERKAKRKRDSERDTSIYKDLNKYNNKQEQDPPLPPLGASLDTQLFREAFSDWLAYKREQFGFRYKPQSLKELTSKLGAMGEARAVAAIRHSIANGWKGIYEPKPAGASGSGLPAKPATVVDHNAEFFARRKHERAAS